MNSADLYRECSGSSPLLINVPHAGTRLPESMAEAMTGPARKLPDTDWFVDRLYAFAEDMDISMLVAEHSRYVIDLNRPPDDAALYESGGPGLVPTHSFAGEPLYLPGQAPSPEDQAARLEQYWQPYHDHLQQRLQSLKDRWGYVLLLDAHSIRSQVPTLFSGRLPELNLGSNNGESADASLIELAQRSLKGSDDEASRYTLVTDARFKGGYITRHYGQPDLGQYALQLEIAQRAYMQESPPAWDKQRAKELRQSLRLLLENLLGWQPRGDG